MLRSQPLIVAWGIVLVGSVARAQSPPEALAPAVELSRQGLIREAEGARAAGDHARALDLAARAGQLRMSPSLRLLLAQEHNALGHTLDALQLATQCAAEARGATGIAHRERILATCEALTDALRRRVGHIIVRVPAEASSSLEVSIQSGSVPRPLWGVDYPVLPGAVTVEATDAHGTFRRELSVGEGATELVDITLTPRPARVATPPAPTGPASTAPTTPTIEPPPPPPPPATSRGTGVGPWIVAGVGLAVVGASVGFFLARGGALDERGRLCPADICRSPEAASSAAPSDGRASLFNALTNVSVAVGSAALVAGVTWYVVARVHAPSSPHPALRWGVAPLASGAAVVFEGAL